MKMFPEFDGRWAYGWIISVEQHCEAKGVSEEKKFSEAEKVLTYDALIWWYDWKRRNQRATWMDFVIALLRKFEPDSDSFLPDPVQDTGEEETQRDEARIAKATNLELRRNWCEEWVQFHSSEDERLEDDGISENKRSEAIPTEIIVTTPEEEAGAKRNEQQPPPKPPDLVLVAGVHAVGNLTKVTERQDRGSTPTRFTTMANRRPPPKPPNWVSLAVAEEKQTDATMEEVASNAKKDCVLGIKTQERVKPEFQHLSSTFDLMGLAQQVSSCVVIQKLFQKPQSAQGRIECYLNNLGPVFDTRYHGPTVSIQNKPFSKINSEIILAQVGNAVDGEQGAAYILHPRASIILPSPISPVYVSQLELPRPELHMDGVREVIPSKDTPKGRENIRVKSRIDIQTFAGTRVSSSLAIANMQKIQHSPKTFDTMVGSCLWQGKPSYSCTELHRLRGGLEQNWKHCQVIVNNWENLKLQPHELGSLDKTSNQNLNVDVGSKGSCVFSFALSFTHWDPGGCSYFSATIGSTSVASCWLIVSTGLEFEFQNQGSQVTEFNKIRGRQEHIARHQPFGSTLSSFHFCLHGSRGLIFHGDSTTGRVKDLWAHYMFDNGEYCCLLLVSWLEEELVPEMLSTILKALDQLSAQAYQLQRPLELLTGNWLNSLSRLHKSRLLAEEPYQAFNVGSHGNFKEILSMGMEEYELKKTLAIPQQNQPLLLMFLAENELSIQTAQAMTAILGSLVALHGLITWKNLLDQDDLAVESKGNYDLAYARSLSGFTHWNSRGCSDFSATTWPTSFQQWDPGGGFYSPYPYSAGKWIKGRLLQVTLGAATYIQEGFSTSILEDKDVWRGGVMIGTQLLGIGPILLESMKVRGRGAMHQIFSLERSNRLLRWHELCCLCR